MKKKLSALLLTAAMTVSLLATPASAFYVGIVSISCHPMTGEILSQTLHVQKEDGSYEKLSVFDEHGNQLYIQVGDNEWEKLDTPLSAEEVARREAEAKAAAEVARVKKKAEMEKTYHIKITDLYADSLSQLENLEQQIQYIPAPLWEKVAAQLSKMGKTLKVEDMRNSVSEKSIYEGLYFAEKVQIELDPFTAALVFPHEYGHLIFMTVLPKLYSSSTLQKEWNALTGGEGPTHVSDYAATDYHEDLAETFQSMVSGYVEYYGDVKELALQYPDCLAVKKINHLRQTLCKAFSLDASLFPDLTPSSPSAWAKDAVVEYQNVLDGGEDSVVPYQGTAHSTGYQTGATRMQFVYAIVEDLVRNLYIADYFDDMTYQEYENKWNPAPARVNGVYQMPFTDVNKSNFSYYAVRAIHSLNLNGIVSGRSATTFDPNGRISRQEAATILYKLCSELGYKFPTGTNTFADSDQIAPWAQEAVRAINAAGIMNGVGGNCFDPTGTYTCEQSAICLLKTYKLLTS